MRFIRTYEEVGSTTSNRRDAGIAGFALEEQKLRLCDEVNPIVPTNKKSCPFGQLFLVVTLLLVEAGSVVTFHFLLEFFFHQLSEIFLSRIFVIRVIIRLII